MIGEQLIWQGVFSFENIGGREEDVLLAVLSGIRMVPQIIEGAWKKHDNGSKFTAQVVWTEQSEGAKHKLDYEVYKRPYGIIKCLDATYGLLCDHKNQLHFFANELEKIFLERQWDSLSTLE